MESRRRSAAVVALALLVAASGCMGFLSGPITFEANKATESQQALQETNYQEENVSQSVITREFSAAGQTKKVKVTNWAAKYHRTVSVPVLGEREAAVFVLFSTPKVKFAGQGPFNPVADYSNEELVKLVQEQYKGLEDVKQVGNYSATMLGNETSVGKFSAKATFKNGQSVDVYVHVTKVEHGSDYVVAVAVHPQNVEEQQKIIRLLEGAQHAGNSSSS